MSELKCMLTGITICLTLFSCTKDTPVNPAGTRLVKVITGGVDSLGNPCSSCVFTQVYKYDDFGKLLKIIDSAGYWMGMYNGPHPMALTYSNPVTVIYNNAGNILKYNRDSFVYNNRNQIVQRYRRIQSDTSRYWLTNNFTYDAIGRLIADTSYTGQTLLNPAVIIYGYQTFTYDASDNMIRYDLTTLWPAGTQKKDSYTAAYDNNTNPYNNLGITAYLIFQNPFLLSKANSLLPGYSYTYYDNGLLKQVSFQGFSQQFFFE